MNPLKLIKIYELEKLLKLKAKLAADGADVRYVDRKIAELEAELT